MAPFAIPRRRRFTLALLAIVLAGCFGATLLFEPTTACADASGCVFHPDSHPGWKAMCIFEQGFRCYICEHTVDGETSVCSENPDGTIQFCKPQEEHQQDPPESG